MNLKVKVKLTYMKKKKRSLFIGEWVLIMERRKRPMPWVTWDDQTPSCTTSLSQERIPTSTSYLDRWQHLSNPQVPWGTKVPRALRDQLFSLQFSMGIGNIRGYGKKKPDQASEPTPLGYLVPWIIFCCCCRISSKPKPLVSSGSSKSQGLGAPRLAPPVIRLDLRTRLNALHSSKNPARPQIAPTGAEGASLACFENSFRPQFIASLVYASNCVQGWKRYEDE